MESANKKNPNISSFPLWRYVKTLEETVKTPGSKGGGNKKWLCSFCGLEWNGSYSRVRSHLLKIKGSGIQACEKIDSTIRDNLQEEDVAAKLAKVKEKEAPLRVSLPPMSDAKKRKLGEGPVAKMFQLGVRDELDKKCSRMFSSAALSFCLAKDPHFTDYIQSLANAGIKGYGPPSYNRLRESLLAQERCHVEKLLGTFKSSWQNSGVSIVSDGWTDIQRKPLINFMAVSSSGCMLLKAVDASGFCKDTKYLSDLFLQVIEEVGPRNVVQVITDNASVCRSAGKVVENKYPHIFWTPCLVHSINLSLKSICQPKNAPKNMRRYEKLKWIADIERQVKDIRIFVVNHHMANSIFNSYSNLKLLRVAETRFASTIVMMRRMKKVRSFLEKMVLDKDWKYMKKSDKAKAKVIRELVLNDNWWDQIDYILDFTEPIMDKLRLADKDTPILHMVNDMWATMIGEVKARVFKHKMKDMLTDKSEFFDILEEILEERRMKSITPLHCVAHSLCPKYYTTSWLGGERNGTKRVTPNQDPEISKSRAARFERLFPSDVCLDVSVEFGKFCTLSGHFSQLDVIGDMEVCEPREWWGVRSILLLLKFTLCIFYGLYSEIF